MRVLIVDDDRHMRRLVRYLLEKDGLECFEAEDGIEALAEARRLEPQVMVLDVMLPGLDGYSVCKMLKYGEHMTGIRIIMLTSRTKPIDKETGYHTGADLYLTKPFEPDELVSAVKSMAEFGMAVK
jgi:DNA-binding response OmpR family regulator